MKIRKANVKNDNITITNVYIYENKKEEYSLIAIPEIEWSTTISYEENRDELYSRLITSLAKNTEQETAEELASKVQQWVSEM
ncbi:YueH family protein [Metabacillus halosaccharovorans]|uniref:YueH family protein n=1 Tax=Metabacillus halosaccharovorans TaxID=930124 RepID=A0ABT3DIN0_9BACI|nr:YueH family protein [Metabacillus halosaccharovorans]MCV9886886.1 YueH family protein [Metabacillus halosaccharovorans]